MRSSNNQPDPIAIVGIGCRFPVDAQSPHAFWQNLCLKSNAVRPIPANRWSIDKFFHRDPGRASKMSVRQGAFLEDIDGFDAPFFGISRREAHAIDPQQRLLLEVSWEALENAGIVPQSLKGSQTGVFMGGFLMDYQLLLNGESNRHLIGPHSATGMSKTLLSNRISYCFDFSGPSLSVDTACSSSLTAIHLACQSLWNKECRLALAGGVNVIFKPEHMMATAKGGFLSPDGQCKTFDQSANGYVRGEGAEVIVLKPFREALENNDSIYSLICGSAINQDGRSASITVPNVDAQTRLLQTVYQQARVSPRNVCYVEAHGTGTQLGDYTEARALANVFAAGRRATQALLVGAVKTNIGHLEAAAGVASVIKASLCLRHLKVPPNLNLTTPNSAIPFDDWRLKLPQEMTDLPADKNVTGSGSTGLVLVAAMRT
jgi:acyl transferase domain-containing protein